MSDRKKKIAAMMLLLIIGLGLYYPSWDGSFHYDDYIYILEKEEIRDITNLQAIWGALSRPTRFIGMYSFALNYHFGGTAVTGYHVVNTILHIFTSMIVFLFILQFLQLNAFPWNAKRQNHAVAWMTALLFLIHPINSQPVNYICQRFVLFATLFYVLALYFYVRARRESPWFFIGVFVSAVLGMFSKEIVFTLPLMIMLMEGMFISKNAFKDMFRLWWIWVILAMLLIIPVVSHFRMVQYILHARFDSWSHIGDTISSMTNFLTQPRVIMRYLQLIFFPIGQSLLHDVETTKSIFELKFLLSSFTIMGLLVAAVKAPARFRLYAFGIFWFFLTLSVESTFVPLRHVMFEHRCYLPSIGIFLMLALAWDQWIKRKMLRVSVVLCVVGILSFLTYQRNQVWHDEISFWTDVIQKAPRLTTNYTHRGMTYMLYGQDDLALADFHQAIQNNPQDGQLYNNRGNLYLQKGQLQIALRDYHQALQLDPQLERTLANRGLIWKKLGEYDLALADFDAALKINERNPVTHYNKANVLRGLKRWEEALYHYSQSIEYRPEHAKAYFYRSEVYRRLGQKESGLQDARQAQQKGLIIPDSFWQAF